MGTSRCAPGWKWGLLFLLAGLTSIAFFFILSSLEVRALDETKCLACHGNPDFSKTDSSGRKISLYVQEKLVNTSAHRFIDCTTCHTAEPHRVNTPLNKLSLAEKCGTCHKYEYKVHLDSVHGQQLRKGNQDVATCVDCHSPDRSPHSVIRTLEYNAPAYKKNIAGTCGNCHGDEKLMADYGIVEKVYESYMGSFHGKAIQLGTYEITQLDKATCINCHGTHDIKTATDPNSPVAGFDNLSRTCEQCHSGGGEGLARGFLGHKDASPQNIPVAYYTEIVFRILLISVISLGAVIVIAAIARFSSRRWRKE